MNCKKCGAALHEGSKFCTNCGEPISVQAPTGTGVNNQSSQTPNPMAETNVNNQSINVIPTLNQNVQSNNFNSDEKDNKKYIILGGVIVAVIVVLGIVLGIRMFKGGENNSKSNIYLSSANYKVKLGNFTFNIPDNLVYATEDGSLVISDENSTWLTYLAAESGSFSSLKTNINKIAGCFSELTINGQAQLKTVDGTEFITLEASESGQNFLMVFTKLNAMYIACLTIQSSDNNYNYDVLSVISRIVKNTTYSDTTNAIASKQFEFKDFISSLAN